jgi:hypothetical protein
MEHEQQQTVDSCTDTQTVLQGALREIHAAIVAGVHEKVSEYYETE